MNRKTFLQHTGVLGAGLALNNFSFAKGKIDFPIVRVPEGQRRFKSAAIEGAIKAFQSKVANKELGWLFNNCFPNTLDTTVFYTEQNGVPDTYVITGDIDAMWLRDSSAQVYPYLQFTGQDQALHQLIAGVIRKQTHFILKDPYANAFYNDDSKVSEWKETDNTDMKPGIHERKWEIDSLCYPIRLAYRFWKETGDTSPFDAKWKEGIALTLKTFKEQQRKENEGPYHFQRKTSWATDGIPMGGYGYPVKPVGLICSMFRPSDDATIFAYLVPSNLFAVVSLKQAAEMISKITKDAALAGELTGLAAEVETAVKKYAITTHPEFGKLYAYEVNAYGSHVLMDDANVPSLLGLPYLGAVSNTDPLYKATRKYIWSQENPFFFKGSAAEGIGGPHIGKDMIWPMSITMKALTSNDDKEIRWCIDTLQKTHGGTGFMHESFHKDDPQKFTRKWFAWSNTLFGELLWKTFKERPGLLG
ncbi:metal-independent alpha-mannosidase [Niabella ginsenosidivorans]|uniref:Metal-independent alpha-mannosidase n=1 Tax=Niabella ginsenosidivorans TaxID=1176587 RepID=A0A1A9HY41_9BACT|nr:glycoside hydrolase family 125 protein [Niabella ginsenosidivorans]ANH80307.1 metal-independent alpha-mannosidase [Niabella ginsenosidivorans]